MQDQKLYYFLLQHPQRTLVFVNAISTLNKLTTLLQTLQLPVVALHANMQQRQRLKNLDRFKASNNLILVVCTSTTAAVTSCTLTNRHFVKALSFC